MKLCGVQKTSLLTLNTAAAPSPIRPSFPGADRAIVYGRRPSDDYIANTALTVQTSLAPPMPTSTWTLIRQLPYRPHLSSLATSRSPLTRPNPSSPGAASKRYRHPTSSNLPAASLYLCERVCSLAAHTGPSTLSSLTREKKAELCQDFHILGKNCHLILDWPDMRAKQSAAITSRKLV